MISDIKQLFGIVDELTGNNKMNANIKPSDIASDKLCDAFAEYFHDKVASLRTGLSPELSDSLVQNCVLSQFSPITITELIHLINSSNSKSCVLYILPTRFLKDNITVLTPFLTSLFISSLLSGIVPESFKSAFVKPLLKKIGLDHNISKNYRPVSNLSFLSKVLERIVAI